MFCLSGGASRIASKIAIYSAVYVEGRISYKNVIIAWQFYKRFCLSGWLPELVVIFLNIV